MVSVVVDMNMMWMVGGGGWGWYGGNTPENFNATVIDRDVKSAI